MLCWTVSTAVFGGAATEQPVAKRTGLITANGNPLTLLGNAIKVGDKAPDFTAYDRSMQPVSLSDYADQVRIITVFPSIDTKVCSLQVRHFNQQASQLHNAQILAISVDLPFALDRFCAAEGIDKVVTLSDYRNREFGLKYGFLIDESRLLARGTIIVDQEGTVRYLEYVSDLGKEPDYEKAIAVAQALVDKS
jgi:thiol peroxidase